MLGDVVVGFLCAILNPGLALSSGCLPGCFFSVITGPVSRGTVDVRGDAGVYAVGQDGRVSEHEQPHF